MAKQDKKEFLLKTLGSVTESKKKAAFRSIKISQNTINDINKIRQINIDTTCAVVDNIIKGFNPSLLSEDDLLEDMYSEMSIIPIWEDTRNMIRKIVAELTIAYNGRVISVNKLVKIAAQQHLNNLQK